ncbi:3-ketoacyl-CoA thiolase A, peroxisomal precursor, putative [Perkinsus marinus ATCC 50983]|uniref:acetyl-CoA C-acyltransferase n=1 Tax=Perkinsus marinus (strain ATCC 50983 / TXsc) TaxID=423536 RepID=C5K6R2_PERM5|nr:3-ketoacyl-CoA thiolase A, peroxisomal precursor, putative [Perkinsus marinus ATCC 50983]EER19982.1 3-ketoacyl-CoA thiolase A, peroxisomal precursor, putative [Perkinsus marinus ATCC 50983]|eukprot:XP_002788186.1 3-ketoacyl-CoA thiolase A, peroxisomal precursor, putative [Perkinsus marinus ATCC 50983]
MNRVAAVSTHVSGGPPNNYRDEKRPDDVVICAALRTPLCKAKRGSFRTTSVEDMMCPVMKAVLERTGVDPRTIGDVQMGNVLQSGSGVVPARMAALMAGIPVEVPTVSINRQCSSGLQAVANIASDIKAGYIKVGLAGGVESMSMYDMMTALDPSKVSENVFEHEVARNCLIPMGMTSENVATKFGITREVQDRMAVESHRKACKAQKDGLFDDEIVPVVTKIVDPKTGKSTTVTVTKDEGCKPDTTLEGLSSLRPAFLKGGSTTAGNASQVTDGAACVLLARRDEAQRQGLPILARLQGFSAVGVPPEIMGIGPAAAIPAVLAQTGLKVDDIDIFEINEAFASQATYCVHKLKIPAEKLNPKGGAIALGHPLGCTGARQIATLLPEMKRKRLVCTKAKLGVVSMCIGGGMGAAGVIVNEQ